MGIDVYLNWENQTEDESKAQSTGFSTDAGDVGYLREAYHGGTYATHQLFTEDWDDQNFEQPEDQWGLVISNDDLMRRLPAAVAASMNREQDVYGGDKDGKLPPAILAEIKAETGWVGDFTDVPLELVPDPAMKIHGSTPMSLVKFVLLHKAKEDAGLNPLVHISY